MRTFGRIGWRLGWVALFAATEVSAAQLVVDPGGGSGSFTSLQQAIDAAAPGDVIVVLGGCYRGIVVDKPLEIIGTGTILRKTASCSTPFSGSGEPDACANTACPALEVGAPGASITLAGFTIDGRWDAGLDDSNAEATIRCAAGTDLRLYDCTVTGPVGIHPTGIAITTAAAIEAPGAMVTLVRTSVTGGEHVTDSGDSAYWLFLVAADGPPAIAAHDVVMIDSTVIGGTQGNYVLAPSDVSCPPSWSSGVNPAFGSGGAGVIASRLIRAGGVLSGGAGAKITDACGGIPGFVYNQQPSGEECNCIKIVTLGDDLASSGPVHAGASWTVAASGAGGLLIVGTVMPNSVIQSGAANGLLFVGAPVVVLPGASFTTMVRPHLVGLEVGVQWLSSTGTLSRPVFEIVQP